MRSSTTIEPVFVFGSNLAGRHGKGAALWARRHRGAIYGQGVGPQGRAYAIPTKDRGLRVLPLAVIRGHVDDFLGYARGLANTRFEVTPIGCGLAGYRPDQIAPMFADAPANVILPDAFRAVLAASPRRRP
ncbi:MULTISPECIES: A1S_2505 family phage non-structural protein [Rhizobium/Agrobacterium group]|uniref:Uncharacterized protein n=1 Tax=Rhizobium subbaraonis TaxID=908946 RepID=A0A285UYA9_9HYPH|nr:MULTISPECIES: hypothetical protein [Rhizobium/Agrobacterium group]WLS06908.1 hypothetical protein Q9314_11910 [Shinella sumterensis]SOC46874.1 hypothetical protein SAMN05892877_1254 [Rhizobium subbaraonis]